MTESMRHYLDNRKVFVTLISGERFYLYDPNRQPLHVFDIAHALSMVCRFAGHCRYFFPVAQHSVNLSLVVEPELALQALFHDAAEFVLGDMVGPLKNTMSSYRLLEHDIMKGIAREFKFKLPLPASIHKADVRMLVTEADELLVGGSATFEGEWPAPYPRGMVDLKEACTTHSRQAFVNRYNQITGETKP